MTDSKGQDQSASSPDEALVTEATDQLFQAGILDEIADDAMHGRLHRRNAMEDAETIVRLVLASSSKAGPS